MPLTPQEEAVLRKLHGLADADGVVTMKRLLDSGLREDEFQGFIELCRRGVITTLPMREAYRLPRGGRA